MRIRLRGCLLAILTLVLSAGSASAQQQATGTISGRITDKETQAPVSGATIEAVTASGRAVGSATTSADGEFRLTAPAGAYSVIVTMLGYQGLFSRSILDEIDLPREFFRTENGLEFFGNVSFLKGGLALSHRLSTVSPGYAQEIQTPEYGAGFDGLLRFRSHNLTGILNGIDVKAWNPATDKALPKRYDSTSIDVKEELRLSLIEQAGFEPQRPVFSIVSRLAHQKGIDLVLAAMPELLDSGISLCILGDGDAALESHFAAIARRFPNRIAAVTRFDDALARLLYAGSDFFLMPSRYEPCGLGQMIAQRYGTPPIVRATGGLRDTVSDGVTGFTFAHVSAHELVGAVHRALGTWRGFDWDPMRRRCMALDWSWQTSAAAYEDVYRELAAS